MIVVLRVQWSSCLEMIFPEETYDRIVAWRSQIDCSTTPPSDKATTLKRKRILPMTPELSPERSQAQRKRQREALDLERTPRSDNRGRGVFRDAPSLHPSSTSSAGDFDAISDTSRSQFIYTASVGTDREPSPTKYRLKRQNLRYTSPPFVMGMPRPASKKTTAFGVDVGEEAVPACIDELVCRLSDTTAVCGCISPLLEDEVRLMSRGMGPIPPYAVGESGFSDMKFIRSILETTRTKRADFCDESAWVDSTSLIMKRVLEDLEVVSAQTKAVRSTHLPRIYERPVGTVKVDGHITLPQHMPETQALYQTLRAAKNEINISAFSDSESFQSFVTGLFEVKPDYGDFEEGVYQLSVAACAMQTSMKRNTLNPRCQDLYARVLPVIAFLVHGHSWNVFIFYRQSDDSVVSLSGFHLPI